MKKIFLAVLVTGLFLLTMTGLAQASLITIGTATYGGSDYNLIWDDNNNGNSIVWLDYTNSKAYWETQKDWAAGLDSHLTYHFNSGYSVVWDDSAWRLPDTVDGNWVFGYDGNTTGGYNITSSEMGHLYYTELGNLGYYATDGTNPQPGWGLNNTGDFDNLMAMYYWSGTEFASKPDYAWYFNMYFGLQDGNDKDDSEAYGLAVRSGQVSAVPIPGAIWLFGSGLLGLVAIRRSRKA